MLKVIIASLLLSFFKVCAVEVGEEWRPIRPRHITSSSSVALANYLPSPHIRRKTFRLSLWVLMERLEAGKIKPKYREHLFKKLTEIPENSKAFKWCQNSFRNNPTWFLIMEQAVGNNAVGIINKFRIDPICLPHFISPIFNLFDEKFTLQEKLGHGRQLQALP